MDLTYCMSQRSRVRKELKKYICAFREEIEQYLKIKVPQVEEIKQMPKAEFDEWIMNNISKFMNNENIDLDLIEMLEYFTICENRIRNSENVQSVL